MSIETITFLSGPVGSPTHRFATSDSLLDGEWHKGALVAPAALTDNKTDDFGLQTGGDFSVEIVDPPDWPRVRVSDLFSPLKHSMVPVRGTSGATFDRFKTAWVPDFEGLMKLARINEIRFRGARRVENLAVASDDLSNAAWQVGGSATKDPDNVLQLPADFDFVVQDVAAGSPADRRTADR
jgi:hypothetical protein